jgi:hypothetical protein
MVKKLTPYKLKVPRKQKIDSPLNRVDEPKEEEGLTGFVGDWEASDIEERFARSLSKEGIAFSFREHFFGPTRTTPGAVEVDFLVQVGPEIYPVFLDGEYAHKSQSQKDTDKLKDARFDELGMGYGFNPSTRIEGEKLQTQEDTDEVVKEMFA